MNTNTNTPKNLSSESMDWCTPGYFLDLVRAVAPIGLDPCAPGPGVNPTGAAATLFQVSEGTARALSDIGEPPPACGLLTRWALLMLATQVAFVNPPYGAHLSGDIDPDHRIMRRPSKGADPVCIGRGIGWARKIVSETAVNRIALVPARPDAEWWDHMLQHADATLLWRSPEHGARLRFVDPDTGKAISGNTAPSTVFFFGEQDVNDGLLTPRAAEMRVDFRHVFRPHGRLITVAS